LIFVGEALIGGPVGAVATRSGHWLVRYADVEAGCFSSATVPAPPRVCCNRSADLVDIAAAMPTTPRHQPYIA
jgi:hypothetical protein